MTPAAVMEQTPAELAVMLEGLDFVNDEEWVRSVYLRAENETAREILTLSYPHFRVDPSKRVVKSVGMGPRKKPGRR